MTLSPLAMSHRHSNVKQHRQVITKSICNVNILITLQLFHAPGVDVIKVVVGSTVVVVASMMLVVIGCVLVCFVVAAMPVPVSSIVVVMTTFSSAQYPISFEVTNVNRSKINHIS